ncbi:MAG: peptide deformylase [Bacteroidetes bacterium]|nr:peptide deformylase [Bacteroidota bacterium]
MYRLLLILLVGFLALPTHSQPLSRYERRLITSGKPDQKMHVTQVTNPEELAILRATSAAIEKPEHRLWKLLAQRMISTVQHPDHKGVGIAAPQVGINRQLIIVQRHDKEDKPFEVYLNPEILAFSDSLHVRAEGCLSIPGKRDLVQRPWGIRLRYQQLNGQWLEEYVEGFTARIFQHEIDHLNGVLFTDKITIEK